jgi:DNA-binding NarL/FixJ family response regulator
VRFLLTEARLVRNRRRGRILVVDDDPVISELIATTLAEHGFDTRCAAEGREALRLVEREVPDVALLDVHLPDISGYQICHRLREDFGDTIGIMLVSGERKESFDHAAGMLLGADDYLAKPFVLEELLARVQHLVRRSRVMPRTLPDRLTPREREILRYLTTGMDHLDIARELVLAPKTIEKHIEHILLKLGVHSRAQAIALAFRDAPGAGTLIELAPFGQPLLRKRSEV